MGAPDTAWGFRPERLLTASILEIDRSRSAPPGGFDVTTEPLPASGSTRFADSGRQPQERRDRDHERPLFRQVPSFRLPWRRLGARRARWPPRALVKEFYDPFDANSVVKILRRGRCATPTTSCGTATASSTSRPTARRPAASVPDNPSTPANEGISGVGIQPDYLFRVIEGKYYGHPNPLQDHFILNGGNPTSGSRSEPGQCLSGRHAAGPGLRPRRDLFPSEQPVAERGYRVHEQRIRQLAAARPHLHPVFERRQPACRAVQPERSGHRRLHPARPCRSIISYIDPLDLIEGANGRLYMLT